MSCLRMVGQEDRGGGSSPVTHGCCRRADWGSGTQDSLVIRGPLLPYRHRVTEGWGRDGRTDGWMDGWTDRCGGGRAWNSLENDLQPRNQNVFTPPVAYATFDLSPGLKCPYSSSPEEDARTSATETSVTRNHPPWAAVAMATVAELVTCPKTSRCPQAYL